MESRRVGGKRKEGIVAYLGTISFRYDRQRFWKVADVALERLWLSAEERSAIEAKLVAVVPRPSEKSLAEVVNQSEAVTGASGYLQSS